MCEDSDNASGILTQQAPPDWHDKYMTLLRQVKLEDDPQDASGNQIAWSRYTSYLAPAAPEGDSSNQVLDDVPNVFPEANSDIPLCIACSVVIPPKTDCVEMKGVRCDRCGHWYHLRCADMLRPPRHRSWACSGCLLEMQDEKE